MGRTLVVIDKIKKDAEKISEKSRHTGEDADCLSWST